MSKHDGRNVAIISAYNEAYLPIAAITIPVLTAYAKKHDYVIHGMCGNYNEDPTNLRDYGDRGKIDMFMQLYDDFELVMFLDTDALVMDHSVRIGERITGNFIWCYDPSGPGSGFWIARCVPEVKNALLAVQRLAQERGGIIARENLGPPHSVTIQFEPRGTSDQTVMTQLMRVPPFNEIFGNCVSGKSIGYGYHDYAHYGWAGLEHIGQYEPGDWIVTTPGLPISEKVKLLEAYAQKAH